MVATFPTQYPSPVAPGGLAQAALGRPLRTAPQFTIRQPDLKFPPQVAGLAGFGTGAGAGIRNNGSDADQSQGLIIIRCGLVPLGSGAVQLTFPGPAIVTGQFVAFADWAAVGPLTVATPTLQISWTANRPLRPFEALHMAYQWAVSQ